MPSISRVGLAALVLLVSSSLAASAQIRVDADNTGSTQNGDSWETAYADLQSAIDNADGSSELWIAEGVYTPDSEGDSFTITGNKDGIELYGGFEGTESTRSERAPKQHRTILSGDLAGDDTDSDGDNIIEDATDLSGENAHHVLILNGGNQIGSDVNADVTNATVIDGLVVTAGQADGSFPDGNGGGVFCDGASNNECSPTLRRVVFAGNQAGNAGGAIYNEADGGVSSPRILNATFTGNGAFEGGAIYNFGVGGTSSPTITNVTFTGNAAGFRGGAIYNNGEQGTSSPKITNVTFTGNAADSEGGAIYNNGKQGTSSSTITNTILWGNNASGSGDEIYNSSAAATLSNTIIEGGVNGSGVDGDSNDNGGGNLDQDPQFIDPSTPAGADGVFATRDDGVNVQDDSPALDAGDNNAVSPTDDITGANRLQDRSGNGTAMVNIGAYEVASSAPPVAITEAPSSVGTTSADFAGVVTPLGAQTTVTFEYRKTGASSFTSVTASESPLIGTFDQSVSASVNGLAPETEYEVRVVASNSEGTDEGSLKSFTTGTLEVAITGGGFGGLDRTFSATPGQANQPVGLFRLTPSGNGVKLTEGMVRTDAPDATGVDRVTLWLSADETFEAAEDTDLTSLDLDPNTVLPSSLLFEGFTAELPDQARYLFVTVTLVDDASGEVTGFLENETALTLSGGQINKVNGNAGQSQFSSLPLSSGSSTQPAALERFEGTVEERGVTLTWRPGSAADRSGFVVQRRASEGGGVDRQDASAREGPAAKVEPKTGSWTDLGFVGESSAGAQGYRFTDEAVPYAADTLEYRLKRVGARVPSQFTKSITVVRDEIDRLRVLGTAPNPVRTQATVRYALPKGTDGPVRLTVYDVLGRRVRSVRLDAATGRNERQLDVNGLSSGVYILRLTADGTSAERRMTVVQ
jgi:predicted outer membrane repeat protein